MSDESELALTQVATPEQIEIIQDKHPIKVLVAGRRWGKGITIACHMSDTAWRFPGCQVWYVAQSYARAKSHMRMMINALGMERDGGFVRSKNEQFPPRLELINGSIMCFRSFDKPDGLLGEGLALCCLDEAAVATKYIYEKTLKPMIADFEHGDTIGGTMLVASTFNGRNWFYDLAQNECKDENVRVWTYPTSTGYAFRGKNGAIKLARLKAKSEKQSAFWSQEFDCEPLAMDQAAFMFVDRIVGGERERSGSTEWQYAVVADIGKEWDPTGIIVMRQDGQVVHEEVLARGMEYREQAKHVARIRDNYINALVAVDSTLVPQDHGQARTKVQIYRDVLGHLLPITWEPHVKKRMVENLGIDMQESKFKVPETCKETLAQLRLYRYTLSAHATEPKFGAPSGEHDDLCAALLMANDLRRKGIIGRPRNPGTIITA